MFFGPTPSEACANAPVRMEDLIEPSVQLWEQNAWGWIGDAGPAIDHRLWPRSPNTGLPMRHAMTLYLPVDYQCRGSQLCAIAYFLGEGEFSPPADLTDEDDPFVKDLRAAEDHPQLVRMADIIDQQFALIWLTMDEIAAGPSAPPPDTRRPGEHEASDGGENAWDPPGSWHGLDSTRTRWIYLAPRRDDPNVGIGRIDEENGWVDPWDGQDPYTLAQGSSDVAFEALRWADHLGGTSWVDGTVEAMSPFYAELATPTQGIDYGNKEYHVIDLATGRFGIG